MNNTLRIGTGLVAMSGLACVAWAGPSGEQERVARIQVEAGAPGEHLPPVMRSGNWRNVAYESNVRSAPPGGFYTYRNGETTVYDDLTLRYTGALTDISFGIGGVNLDPFPNQLTVALHFHDRTDGELPSPDNHIWTIKPSLSLSPESVMLMSVPIYLEKLDPPTLPREIWAGIEFVSHSGSGDPEDLFRVMLAEEPSIGGSGATFWDPSEGFVSFPDFDANLVFMLNVESPYCPADVNESGETDINDFFTFLAWFEAGDPRADWNADGEIDVGDFFDFLADFEDCTD